MADIPNRGQKPPQGFTRREYDVAGTRVVTYEAGDGPPFLFFHGAGTFHGIDFAREWTRQFRVILPYHPGFGETAADPGFGTMADYVAHYGRFCGALGLTRFHLGGISLGGWMAVEFAARFPELVDKLVLVAPAGLRDKSHPPADLNALDESELLSYLAHDPAVFEPYLPKSAEDGAAFQAMLAGEGETLAKLIPEGPERDGLEPDIRSLAMPTLLLWGNTDRLLPSARAEQWRQLLPNGETQFFDDAGHVLLDESAEARRAVGDFLAG